MNEVHAVTQGMVGEFDSWDLIQEAARDGSWMRNEKRTGRG